MIYKLIENCISKLKPSDVEKFAKENGINLTSSETDVLYNTIKKNWYTIIYEDSTPIFIDIKTKLKDEIYISAIEELETAKEKTASAIESVLLNLTKENYKVNVIFIK